MMIVFAVLCAEILISIVSGSDTIRAAAVGVVIALTLVVMFFSWCMSPSLGLKRYMGKPTAMGAAMIGIGLYGLLAGVLRHNNPYYIAADIYHWYFELILMAALTVWAAARSDSVSIAVALGIQGIVLGGLGLFTFVVGTAGLPIQAGHIVPNLQIWRLELARGFPELPLVFITAALFVKRHEPWPRRVRILLWIAFAIYFPGLVVTLKRSMWLSYLGGVVLLLIPRRKLILGAVTALVSLPVMASFVILFRKQIIAVLITMGDLLTYNPAYSVEDTLGERIKQMISMGPYLFKNMYGYGMGAQFYGYWPGENTFGVVHYIHNLYMYYLLQLGVPGTALMLLVGAWLAWTLVSCMDRDLEWNWLLRAGFSSLMIIAVNGMVLIPIHTAFAGFVVGLALMAYVRVRVPLARMAPEPLPSVSLTLGKGAVQS